VAISYMIKFFSDLQQVYGLSQTLWFSPSIKLYIVMKYCWLLKVVLKAHKSAPLKRKIPVWVNYLKNKGKLIRSTN